MRVLVLMFLSFVLMRCENSPMSLQGDQDIDPLFLNQQESKVVSAPTICNEFEAMTRDELLAYVARLPEMEELVLAIEGMQTDVWRYMVKNQMSFQELEFGAIGRWSRNEGSISLTTFEELNGFYGIPYKSPYQHFYVLEAAGNRLAQYLDQCWGVIESKFPGITIPEILAEAVIFAGTEIYGHIVFGLNSGGGGDELYPCGNTKTERAVWVRNEQNEDLSYYDNGEYVYVGEANMPVLSNTQLVYISRNCEGLDVLLSNSNCEACLEAHCRPALRLQLDNCYTQLGVSLFAAAALTVWNTLRAGAAGGAVGGPPGAVAGAGVTALGTLAITGTAAVISHVVCRRGAYGLYDLCAQTRCRGC